MDARRIAGILVCAATGDTPGGITEAFTAAVVGGAALAGRKPALKARDCLFSKNVKNYQVFYSVFETYWKRPGHKYHSAGDAGELLFAW